MTIEEQQKKAMELEELQDHLIEVIESDDKRFSFEWGYLGSEQIKMGIYDKEKKTSYIVKIEEIKYDENDEPVNI